MLFDFSQLLSLGDLLNLCLFHIFFTLSSDLVRMFTLIDYHFFVHLSRGIFLFFEKYFIFSSNVQLFYTKISILNKKRKKATKKASGKAFTFPLILHFSFSKTQKVWFFKDFFNRVKLPIKSDRTQKESNYCTNCTNEQSAEIGACEATAVTALVCNCVYQKEDPTNYGNGVQNAASEIVPRREGSVCLRKEHIGVLSIDFCLFHNFFTLSSAKAEILHL